jgi:predicted unusual protein kinase regulating ubiquinone biosynthesis (AarF/ABC1/UbiB family)
MEWVEGARLVNKEQLSEYGADPTKLVDTLVQCSLKQMLEVRRPYYPSIPLRSD